MSNSEYDKKYAHLPIIRQARAELDETLGQSEHYRGRKRLWGFFQIPTELTILAGGLLLYTQNPDYVVPGLIALIGGTAASAFAARRFGRARANESQANYRVGVKRGELERLQQEHNIIPVRREG